MNSGMEGFTQPMDSEPCDYFRPPCPEELPLLPYNIHYAVHSADCSDDSDQEEDESQTNDPPGSSCCPVAGDHSTATLTPAGGSASCSSSSSPTSHSQSARTSSSSGLGISTTVATALVSLSPLSRSAFFFCFSPFLTLQRAEQCKSVPILPIPRWAAPHRAVPAVAIQQPSAAVIPCKVLILGWHRAENIQRIRLLKTWHRLNNALPIGMNFSSICAGKL